MKKDSIRILSFVVITIVVLCVVFLTAYKINYDKKSEELLNNPNLLMAGGHSTTTRDYPFLLSINPNNLSLSEVNLDVLKNSDITGFHEARPFMINGEYKIALGTYVEGKVLILASDDPYFRGLHIVLEEAFDGERVRSVFTGDIDGDGSEEVVIGTRPSGIIKYYTYKNGAWIGSEIDKIGMSVHDIMIADLDGDGNKEIYVTASTTSEFTSHNLSLKTPEIIKYTLSKGAWDKKVVWKPENPVLQDGSRHLYAHPRYMFTGDFFGNGQSELVSGVIKDATLFTGLLLLKPSGSGYSQYFQSIGGIKANTEVIAAGDIDNDGKDEILLPTLTGDAILIYRWLDDKWEQSVVARDLVDKKSYNESIVSMAILNSISDGRKKILYVTANGSIKDGENPKFYTLSYSAAKNEWIRVFVSSPTLPMMEAWGIFPMSSWKVHQSPNP